MSISTNFTSILEQNLEINFLQCYPNGFLKYTELCNLFQLAAGLHAELGGISFKDMQVYNQAWVLSKMKVEIKRMPKWKDKVKVKTWIYSLENSRSIRCLELYIGTEKIVGCETLWVVFNTNNRRPEQLTLPHEHFEKYSVRATEVPFDRINFKKDMIKIDNHTVKLSDLDIVNNANRVKYLEWCLDVIDNKIIQNQIIKSFEMNYLKEVSLNEEVIIKLFDEIETKILSVQKDEKVCFGLQLQLK